MSSAPAAALSTAPLSLSQEEQNLKSLWTALSVAEKQRERRGLDFGKACYELRASAEGVQGGTTFRPTLEKLGIPHSTAYFWIARYEESVGEREASPKVGIREAEPKPAAVAPVKTLGEMPAFGEAPEPAETAPKTYAEANDEELQALAHRLDSVLGKIEGITLDAQSLVDKPKWRGLLWRELPSFPSVVAQCDKLAKSAAQLAETASRLLTGSCVKPEVKPAKGEPAPQNDVDYVPEFLSQAEADELYSFLIGQPHENNRLSYGPQVYPMKAQDVSAAWAANPQPEPDLIKALRERMSLRYGVPFNSVQCNYHGSESKVRNHPDSYGMVSMIRVGATRIFEIGDKPYGGCKYTGYEMPHGSLVTMKRSLQHKMSPQPGDVSISVIFRHVTPGQTDAGWYGSDGKVNAVRNREHHRAYDAAVAKVAPAPTSVERRQSPRPGEKLIERIADSAFFNENCYRSMTQGVDAAIVKQLTRDRRDSAEMKAILASGGTEFKGKRIMGSASDPYIQRWTRQEVRDAIAWCGTHIETMYSEEAKARLAQEAEVATGE